MLITLDFETYYDDKYSLKKMPIVEYINHPLFLIHGVGIQVGDDFAYWVPGHDAALAAVKDVFHAGNNHCFLAQNTQFDGLIATQFSGIQPAYWADTLAMSAGIFPGLSHSLKEIGIRLGLNATKGDELEQTKGLRELPPEIEKALGGYCINDVEMTSAAYNVMKDHLSEEEHDLINLITRMYTEPMLILDRQLVAEHEVALKKERLQIIEDSGLCAKTLGSSDKFSAHLQSIGVPVPTKISDKGNTIPAFGKNDPGFQDLQREYPEHSHLWEARIAVKSTSEIARCGRFLDATVADNLLPIPLKYSGAANTHRLSGGQKINAQNLKRGSNLRLALMAPDGYQVVVADSSQIEARVLCDLAGQLDVLELFRRGVDTYCVMASKIYGFEVIKGQHDTERFVGKVTRLGLGFGMGSPKFADTLRTGAMGAKIPISDKDAFHIVYEVFRPENAQIVGLWKIAQEVWLPHMLSGTSEMEYGPLRIGKGYIRLPNEMYLHFPNLQYHQDPVHEFKGQWSYFDGKKRVNIYGGKLVENAVQALARIVVMYQMLESDEWLTTEEVGRMVHTVHDEGIAIVRNEAVEQYKEIVTAQMRQAPHWMPNIPLDCEIKSGQRYQK